MKRRKRRKRRTIKFRSRTMFITGTAYICAAIIAAYFKTTDFWFAVFIIAALALGAIIVVDSIDDETFDG